MYFSKSVINFFFSSEVAEGDILEHRTIKFDQHISCSFKISTFKHLKTRLHTLSSLYITCNMRNQWLIYGQPFPCAEVTLTKY